MRPEAQRRLGGVGALLIAGLGCGQTVEAGFANAPSARRNSPPRRQYDAIGNGPESCGKDQPGEQYREPSCAQADNPSSGAAAPSFHASAPNEQEKREP
jgi:hypothetical protein